DAREPARQPVLEPDHAALDGVADLPRPDPPRDHLHHQLHRPADRPSLRAPEELVSEGEFSLRATGHARRRLLRNRFAEVGMIGAALVALAVLAILVGSVLVRALPALNLDLITKGPGTDSFGRVTGGIAPAIVGSLMLVLIAAFIAIPIGV